MDLIVGLLKFWPITCPAKEVLFITELEEILEIIGVEAEKNFGLYGCKLLSRLVKTAQNMHYQAAERSLMLLNNEAIHKMVKQNMKTAFPIVVKGLANANRGPNAHWNPSVNTLTLTVVRQYMEMNRDLFEKLASSQQQSGGYI